MGPASSFEMDISLEKSFRKPEYEDICICRFDSKLNIPKFVFPPTSEIVKVFFVSGYNVNFSGFDRFKNSS